MDERLWQQFVNWCAQQERVTFYKASQDMGGDWYIEWFNAKALFKYVTAPHLEDAIIEALK